VYCTPGRSRKIVATLATALLAEQVIINILSRFYVYSVPYKTLVIVHYAVFYVVLPVTVLVINMAVACAVRRASNDAAAKLGQQSASSNSAVPTVLLISTSLIYVLLRGTLATVHIVYWYVVSPFSYVMGDVYYFTTILHRLVYAYNFYVYIVTGKLFRQDLRKLFHCCT